MHHEGVDEARVRMMKRAGKTPDNFEAEALPECQRAFVRTHDKIKLHGLEATFARAIEGMRAHRARHTSPGGPGSGYVAAVGYVRAAALLVRLQKIRAENSGVIFRDEDFVPRSKPVVEGFAARHLSRQRVCLAGADRRFQNCPNEIGVGR